MARISESEFQHRPWPMFATTLALTSFLQRHLKRPAKYGRIPMEKLNLWGGSVGLGHPFGATGVRLLSHAAHRLKEEGGRYAIVAGCAVGGTGVAQLVEMYP